MSRLLMQCWARRFSAIELQYAHPISRETFVSTLNTTVWRPRSLSPVDTLPNEVLIEIFTHATTSQRQHQSLDMRFLSLRPYVEVEPLLNLTHVCKRWRNVAINFAPLWTFVDCHDLDMLETFAERAKSLPLSLCLDTHGTTTSQDMEDSDAVVYSPVSDVLKPLAHRLRRLDVFWDPQSTMETLRDKEPPRWITSLEMPVLECLNIVIDTSEHDIIRRWTFSESALILLFAEMRSSLRALAIEGSTWWVPRNDFLHLTHLYLSFIKHDYVDVSIVLAILSKAPNLESLHLADLEFAAHEGPAVLDDYDASAPDRKLDLKHLSSILLSGVDCAALLMLCPHLALPSPLAIRAVSSYITEDTQFAVPPVISEDAVSLEMRLSRGTESMGLFALEGPSSGLLVHGWCSDIWPMDSRVAWFEGRMQELSDTVLLEQLTSFTMDVIGVETQPLLRFLARMHALESLSLLLAPRARVEAEQRGVEYALAPLVALCAALSPPTDSESPAGAGPSQERICPALRRLRLGCDMPPTADRASMDRVAATLARMLEARVTMDFPALALFPALDELVVQPVIDTETAMELEEDELAAALSELELFVAALSVLGPSEELFDDFEARDVWFNRGEDVYWVIPESDRPQCALDL